jgi:hypothetical protein
VMRMVGGCASARYSRSRRHDNSRNLRVAPSSSWSRPNAQHEVNGAVARHRLVKGHDDQ